MGNCKRYVQVAFFLLIIRPVLMIILGLRVLGRENLPCHGPAIVIANHNSHLDTLVLMSLFRLSDLHRVRPVAAADYFLRTPLASWLSHTLINIIPIVRTGDSEDDPLCPVYEALKRDEIIIFFPEGSRGVPEKILPFRRGIGRLVQSCPAVEVFPVFMHGLGKALPKGDPLLVPFFCDIIIGKAVDKTSYQDTDFTMKLEQQVKGLAADHVFPGWE
ncbi:MAG: 1-acyl-sn-glycerol-3-phosphate acyltransferase [Micavibrio aeruginosavorus]|uniref:1-acyl-sn-glycerol-3-phosphate acyltransferase n=1 Tax=Micavibrio aeruginosavorus TaxID=349221 RepID=A0A7T5UGX1_9BACT|nr:MAG: 1-acyl-sn-glycerol-3-phosphate acyltransferase [Micavibrio aeruginosavorus]